jgi:hypothetical protein
MSTRISVIGFLLITLLLGGYYGAPFFNKLDKRAHLPGETSDGHYQIEMACDQCHTRFGGVKNDACEKCHGADHAAANDSHPGPKFADPRNAERSAGLDAQSCVTCHREHVPDRTHQGVTIPDDFCVKCHKKDEFEDRPTHKDLAPQSCARSGCHNFHDNRALYEDFLVKHLHEPDQHAVMKVLLRSSSGKDVKPLSAKNQNAPGDVPADATLVAEWESTAHAKAGVNCTGCHQVNDPANGGSRWQTKLDHTACKVCHMAEDEGFLKGRHGMRIAIGLPPMSPGMARLPMKPEAKHEELSCNSCHRPHKFDTGYAAVDACLGCHNDEHSLDYKASRHFKLWEEERDGKAETGTGVSCATCHLPREAHKDGGANVTRVQHNQNENLRPNDKMLRSVCMSCHGLDFSMDALADQKLVRRNFNGRPGTHVGSLEMAEKRLGAKSKKGE